MDERTLDVGIQVCQSCFCKEPTNLVRFSSFFKKENEKMRTTGTETGTGMETETKTETGAGFEFSATRPRVVSSFCLSFRSMITKPLDFSRFVFDSLLSLLFLRRVSRVSTFLPTAFLFDFLSSVVFVWAISVSLFLLD